MIPPGSSPVFYIDVAGALPVSSDDTTCYIPIGQFQINANKSISILVGSPGIGNQSLLAERDWFNGARRSSYKYNPGVL